MGLITYSIRTWEEMKNEFLLKYKDFYMPHNQKDEVFKMIQREDENLEDLIERFSYNLKRPKMENLDRDTLKALLLKSIRDEWIDILNIMGTGDMSLLSLPEISKLCIHLSRGQTRFGKNSRDPVISIINKSATRIVSRDELGNFLDEFITKILGSLSEQIDTLKL